MSGSCTHNRSVVNGFAGLAGLMVSVVCPTVFSQTVQEPLADNAVSQSIEVVAERLAGEYGQQQMRRLAKNSDRDSLIAAALIGPSNDAKREPPEGQAEVVQRLVDEYPTDSLALYTAALICHVQSQACAHEEYQTQLLRLAPDNAIHFLLVPNAGKPSRTQLHLAALAGKADTHFSALLGIVRSALAGQPAPPYGQGGTFVGNELALLLRRNEVLYVPWPNYGPTMGICNAEVASRHEDLQLQTDCSNLGRKLFSDDGDNIATRMVGSSMVRRFARGTPADAEAKALRSQYVWLNEQLPDDVTSAQQEQLQQEEVLLGEWEAYQRSAERAGVARRPPADWIPKNPEALLLSEERKAKPSSK